MEKQKKQLAKQDAERLQYKNRIKELTEEMSMMQGREMQGSDEDSPDQLSDIDKQQELMSNISMKNKHIKRLLRDIEVGTQFNTQIIFNSNFVLGSRATIIGTHSRHQRAQKQRRRCQRKDPHSF